MKVFCETKIVVVFVKKIRRFNIFILVQFMFGLQIEKTLVGLAVIFQENQIVELPGKFFQFGSQMKCVALVNCPDEEEE